MYRYFRFTDRLFCKIKLHISKKPRQLRQINYSTYIHLNFRTIQALDVHQNDAVCQEIQVYRECADRVLEETSCEKDVPSKNAMLDADLNMQKRYDATCLPRKTI